MVGTPLVRSGCTWSSYITEGVFGVTFNDITKDDDFYTPVSRFVVCLGSLSQERQVLWLTKTSWSSPPGFVRSSY
jgi:hypothetical protein